MKIRRPYAAPETHILLPCLEEVMEMAVISTIWKDASEADAKIHTLNTLSFDDEDNDEFDDEYDEELGWVAWKKYTPWEE